MAVVAASGTGTVSGTSEGAVLTTEPTSNTNLQGGGFRVNGVLTFTGNASASTVVVKVRQGSGTSGTTVYTSPALTVGAAAVAAIPFDCVDSVQGATQYTVTLTPSAALGASGAVVATMAIADVAYYAD